MNIKAILLFISLFILQSGLLAQNVKAGPVEKLTDKSQGVFAYPKVSPEGKVFFTTDNFKGIYFYDEQSKSIEMLNNESGSGYEFAFSPNGQTVIYRSDNFINNRKYSSLKEQNILTREIKTIQPEQRNVDTPVSLGDGKVVYGIDDNLQILANDRVSKVELSKVNETLVQAKMQEIHLYSNGIKRILKPLGDRYYIWVSLSPDKTKLLFNAAGSGTYISDLNGDIITNLGKAHYANWSPDGNWISYMVDKDNGEVIIASDIYVASVDGKHKYQLTKTDDVIEVYPSWSNDGKKIVFATNEGEIFILPIIIEEN